MEGFRTSCYDMGFMSVTGNYDVIKPDFKAQAGESQTREHSASCQPRLQPQSCCLRYEEYFQSLGQPLQQEICQQNTVKSNPHHETQSSIPNTQDRLFDPRSVKFNIVYAPQPCFCRKWECATCRSENKARYHRRPKSKTRATLTPPVRERWDEEDARQS